MFVHDAVVETDQNLIWVIENVTLEKVQAIRNHHEKIRRMRSDEEWLVITTNVPKMFESYIFSENNETYTMYIFTVRDS